MYSYPPLVNIGYSLPYVVVLCMYLCAYLISESKTWKQYFNYSYAVFFVLLVYFIFVGFRGYICTDWYNYYPMFQETPCLLDFEEFVSYSNSVFTEKGYLFYISLFKVLCNDYVVFQAFSVLIDLVLIHLCIKKYSSNYLFTFLILSVFFYVQSVNLNRNVKSILLFLYALRYIEERKFWKYSLFNLIGLCFHSISLIFFVLYFFLRHRFSVRTLWIVFIFSNIYYFSQVQLFSLIATAIDGMIGGKVGHAIHFYLAKESAVQFSTISIGSLERLMTFIVLILNYNKVCATFKYGRYFANMMLLYLLCYLIFNELPILVTRFSQQFGFAYGIFYSYIISLYSNSKNVAIYKTAICCYLLLWTLSTHRQLMDKYDNFLFGHQSFEERARVYDHYGSAYLGMD